MTSRRCVSSCFHHALVFSLLLSAFLSVMMGQANIFKPAKPIVLRGTAQQIAVNVGNAALTGGNLTVTFEWIETTTP